MDIGAKLIRAICAKGDVYAFVKSKLEDKHFYTADEKHVFNFVNDHVNNYHALPKEQTLLDMFPEIPPAVEPVNYYSDKVMERYAHKTMNNTLGEVSVMLENKEVEKSILTIQEMIGEIVSNNLRTKIAEFGKDGLGIVQQAYHDATTNPTGILFGWDYLDAMTQGLFAGDVFSICGRPASGKTYLLLRMALLAYKLQHKNILFVSMEMPVPALVQRLTGILAQVSVTELKKGILPTGKPKDMWKHTQNVLIQQQTHDSKLWILDGNLSSTPEQIYTLANQFGPDAVYIDGAYLLKHPNKRLDRYTRVADNIEYIKSATSSIEIPSSLSYQFSREATKKKTNEEVGLEDIAFSDAIGQISSIVLGMFQEETIEAMISKRVNVLKGREGATGGFDINWNFNTMDFSEIPKQDDVLSTGQSKPLMYI